MSDMKQDQIDDIEAKLDDALGLAREYGGYDDVCQFIELAIYTLLFHTDAEKREGSIQARVHRNTALEALHKQARAASKRSSG